MNLSEWLHPPILAERFRELTRIEPVDPLDNTRIANLMSAEKLTFDEAKARVVGQ